MINLSIVYGAISGLVIIGITTLSANLGSDSGQAWIGFLVMFIAFSSIFVAVKQYRDETLGGMIGFKTALLVGLSITVVASVVYVLGWEVYLALTDYAFIDLYIQSMQDSLRAEGASLAELAALAVENDSLRQQYANPLIRLPMTFTEIFPVGVLISLISATILKDSGVLAAE